MQDSWKLKWMVRSQQTFTNSLSHHLHCTQALDSALQAGALLTKPPSPKTLRVPTGFKALAIPLVLPLPPSPISASNVGSISSTHAAVQRGGGAVASGHWASSAFAASPAPSEGDAVCLDYGMQVRARLLLITLKSTHLICVFSKA